MPLLSIMPTRRSMLAGLGTVLGGSGALVGSGAFSSVDAERRVTVQTAGDADALLAIEPGPDGEPYLVGDGTDGPLAIDLTAREGFNRNGTTAIDQLLTVTNNGTNAVSVGFRDQYAIDEGDYDNDELPGGWGYAVSDDDGAAVVVWAAPADADRASAELRPGLNTTGFGSGSTLIDGRTIKKEVRSRTEREVDQGGAINIGILVDTRESTIEENRLPDALDETITVLADTLTD